MSKSFRIVATAIGLLGCLAEAAGAQSTTFRDAQRLFYSARFEAAAALADTARDAEGLAASELRSSALLFQIRRTFGEPADKDLALKQCSDCRTLTTAFLAETTRGQALARTLLQLDPADEDALFYLGKLDLNYVWLQLGTFGRRAGWSEYWEARRFLDAVLKATPKHGARPRRARLTRAAPRSIYEVTNLRIYGLTHCESTNGQCHNS